MRYETEALNEARRGSIIGEQSSGKEASCS
jgi:hypothetical protein